MAQLRLQFLLVVGMLAAVLLAPAQAADTSSSNTSSGIELTGRPGAAPPAWWLVEEAGSGKRVAQIRQRWGFAALPPGEYRISVVPEGQRALPVPWRTVTVHRSETVRLAIASGIELTAPPELPPPEWWFVEDAESGERLAQVHQRWGYTPLPAGVYTVKLVPQGHGALPVGWGKTEVPRDRAVRIQISSGVRLAAGIEAEAPPEWWFVEDTATGERVAQVHQRWGFTPLPPGHYAVQVPHDYVTGRTEVQVGPDEVATVRPQDLGVGRLEIELPASRNVRFASGARKIAVGFRRGEKLWGLPLPEGEATSHTGLDLEAGPLAIVYQSGGMQLEVPVTVMAGATQQVPFDPAKLAADNNLSLLTVEVTDAAGARVAGEGQVIITEPEAGALLTLERVPSGTLWLAPAGASARWRVGGRERAYQALPVGAAARLSLPQEAPEQGEKPPPIQVDIVIQSPPDGALVDTGDVTVTGRASTTAEAGVTQIALVIDSSGSTSEPSGVDLNGDGKEESILNAELAAARVLLDELAKVEANTAGTAFAVTLLRFSEQADVLAPLTPLSDASGVLSLRQALVRVAEKGSGGDTYYDRALDAAVAAFRAAELPGVRIVLLISDGKPSDLKAGLAAAARAGLHKVIIHSFGLGGDFRGDVPAEPSFPPYPTGGVDILATVAALGRAGGKVIPLPRPGDIVAVVPSLPVLELPDAELEAVRVANETTGQLASEVQLSRDGAFQARLPVSLIPRSTHEANTLVATAIARGGQSQASDRVRVRTAVTGEVRQALEGLRRAKADLLVRNRVLQQEAQAREQRLRSRIAELEEAARQEDLEGAHLQEEREACQRERERLQQSLAATEAMLQDLRAQVADLEQRLQTSEGKHKTLAAQALVTQAELSGLRDALQSVQSDAAGLRDGLAACEARTQALQELVAVQTADRDRLSACTAALDSARAEQAGLSQALTACRASPGSLRVTAVSRGGRVPPALLPQVELIFDASNSMWGQIEGRPKIAIAKEVMEQVIRSLPEGIPVALRVYGHRWRYREARACRDSELIVPFSELEKARMLERLRDLVPRGTTPLAYSLAQIPEDFRGVPGEKIVVVVTDGKEECGGHPQDAVRQLKDGGFRLVLHVVGFALADEPTKDAMRQVARMTGGRFFDAQAPAQLRDALRQSFSVPLTVFGESGEPAASGHVGQGDLPLPPGRYEVVVQAPRGAITVSDVVITPGRTTSVLLQETRDGMEASVQPGAAPGGQFAAGPETDGAGMTRSAAAPSAAQTPAAGEPR